MRVRQKKQIGEGHAGEWSEKQNVPGRKKCPNNMKRHKNRVNLRAKKKIIDYRNRSTVGAGGRGKGCILLGTC